MNIISPLNIFMLLILPGKLSLQAQNSSAPYTKMEVYGMDWQGHYIISPKPGHVMMKEHRKLIINKKRKVKSFLALLKAACTYPTQFANLSYYCGFLFISKSDTTTFFIASRMESEKIYVRNESSFFITDQKAISAILKLFPKKQIPKIAVSLPLDRSVYDLYSQKKWN